MWVPFWSHIDDIERLSHFRRKAMITVFCSGTGEFLIELLPESRKWIACTSLKA
jgi:hypothetical protein